MLPGDEASQLITPPPSPRGQAGPRTWQQLRLTVGGRGAGRRTQPRPH